MAATTSTTPSTPRLSEVARHLVIPDGITTSVFPRVYRRLNEVGVSFDQWQRGFGQVALGCRENGLYAATVGGVVAPWPRQVGKTFTVGNLVIGACLEFPGLRVIWTSHHNRTTTNTFRSMQSMVRKGKIRPYLKLNKSEGIRTTNGEQEIEFANGSIIMFGAREHGFGRGMDAVDWEIFDEAQILGLKALEDMVPATNAAKHKHGGLVFFLGTPPRPGDDGEAFTAKRQKAIDGLTTDQVYVEISADPDTDPDDQSMFGTFNPSFPHRTPLESMLRMRENIPDVASWRREAMGIWDTKISQAVIAADRWGDLVGSGPADGTKPDGLGVDMSHDRQISVAACWRDDDTVHGEEVWAGINTVECVDWIVDRAKRKMPVFIDSIGPASALIPELKSRGVNVVSSSANHMAKGCEQVESRAKFGTLTHAGQSSVDEALAAARKRPIRDAGGWGWDRSDPSKHIHPIVAFTLAVVAALSVRKKTGVSGFA